MAVKCMRHRGASQRSLRWCSLSSADCGAAARDAGCVAVDHDGTCITCITSCCCCAALNAVQPRVTVVVSLCAVTANMAVNIAYIIVRVFLPTAADELVRRCAGRSAPLSRIPPLEALISALCTEPCRPIVAVCLC